MTGVWLFPLTVLLLLTKCPEDTFPSYLPLLCCT